MKRSTLLSYFVSVDKPTKKNDETEIPNKKQKTQQTKPVNVDQGKIEDIEEFEDEDSIGISLTKRLDQVSDSTKTPKPTKSAFDMKPIEKKTTTITTTSIKNTFEDKSKDLSDIYDLVQVEEYNDEEEESTTFPITACWLWKGDNNQWIEYDDKLSRQLEQAFKQNEKVIMFKDVRVKVDNQRFVDLKSMVQRRYDDETKIRPVKREPINSLANLLSKTKSSTTKSSYLFLMNFS